MSGTFIKCSLCTRGGRGNDPQPCSCGWDVTDLSSPLGCFLGTPIVGERPVPKLTRSQQNYQRYLEDDSGLSFAEWLSGGARR